VDHFDLEDKMSDHPDATPKSAAAKQVVLGVSDSPSGRAALAVAARLAQARGARLHLVRVWREAGWLPSMTASYAAGVEHREQADNDLLDRAARTVGSIAPEVSVTAEFVAGDLYSTLLSRCSGAELLVLGSADSASADHLISEWFVPRSSCPVVVVDADGRVVHAGRRDQAATA
jgi:nucleotide-binding universal stress UspA family protein